LADEFAAEIAKLKIEKPEGRVLTERVDRAPDDQMKK
jgi:hypothetical protein